MTTPLDGVRHPSTGEIQDAVEGQKLLHVPWIPHRRAKLRPVAQVRPDTRRHAQICRDTHTAPSYDSLSAVWLQDALTRWLAEPDTPRYTQIRDTPRYTQIHIDAHRYVHTHTNA